MRVYVEIEGSWWSYDPDDFLDQLDRWEERGDIDVDEDLARTLAGRPNVVYGTRENRKYGALYPYMICQPDQWPTVEEGGEGPLCRKKLSGVREEVNRRVQRIG